jgi:predicted membrane protein
MKFDAQVIINLTSSTVVLVAALAVVFLFPANLSIGARVMIGLLAVCYFLYRVFRIVKVYSREEEEEQHLSMRRKDDHG